MGNNDNESGSKFKMCNDLFQLQVVKKYNKNLISIKIDYPEKNANNYLIKNIMGAVDSIVDNMFRDNIYMKVFRNTETGPMIICLLDLTIEEVKDICVEIEHKNVLGEILNIELYNAKGTKVERNNIHIEEKKCSLCGEAISKCKRHNIHSKAEIIENIKKMYKQYIDNYL